MGSKGTPSRMLRKGSGGMAALMAEKRGEVYALEDQIAGLKDRLKDKDKEIKRLNRMIDKFIAASGGPR